MAGLCAATNDAAGIQELLSKSGSASLSAGAPPERCCKFVSCVSAKTRARCHAARLGAVAASVLDVMAPLRPLGKKPPCFAPALFPNAR